MDLNILNFNEEKNLTLSDRREYYQKLKNYCVKISKKNRTLGQNIIKKMYLPSFYNDKLIINGKENIPLGKPILFVCNHSNSHDIFSMYIILSKLNIDATVMVASDCLSPMTNRLFRLSDATMFNRNDKIAAKKSIVDMSAKVLSGKSGVIFGESTWNLHPIKPMQQIKIGASRIAAITNAYIVPTIMEYIEISNVCSKELEIYDKIFVQFGEAIEVKPDADLCMVTSLIQNNMENMRKNIWYDFKIKRDCIDDLNIDNYINHTYIKKFNAFGFQYNSLKESTFLRPDINGIVENEYHLDNDGNFVPGVTLKKEYHLSK